MNATILPEIKKHYPVLLNEIISIITPQYGGTFIDCTFGQGGYTKKILEYPGTKVFGLDRDEKSKNIASQIEKKFKHRFFFKNEKFSSIDKLNFNNEKIKAVIFDLGYSYTQIKDSKKGLSFNDKGELNMKMGLNQFSANDVINKLDQKDLDRIFKIFGEEKESKKIANNIVKIRKEKKIDTQTLVKIIESSKRKKNYKIHNSTKVFQALRIFVNQEISELIYGLINATKILDKNGLIIIVSFHSIEDRIIKYFFKSLSEIKNVSRYMPKSEDNIKIFKVSNKKPILPSKKEIEENYRSRSAKLRFAIKEKNTLNFEADFLNKFNYLIDIENLSKKL